MSKCPQCKEFLADLKLCKDLDDVKEVRRRRSVHIQEVREERDQYHKHRNMAVDHPDSWMSLIIDGMDQKKTDIPRACGKRDRDDGKDVIKTRVIGVKVHGFGNFFYVTPPDIPHDTNTTWSIILDVLNRLHGHREFPPSLWIQMDNTTADNKTKLTFMCQRLLVQAGIFREVVIGFLPVGHTHEDIDQAFSVIAQYLKRHPVDTFDQLALACRLAFKTITTHAEVLDPDKVFDFRRWIGHDFTDQELRGITTVHNVRFTSTYLDTAGVPIMQYREWMKQEDWITYTRRIDLKLGKAFYRPSLFAWDLPKLERVWTVFREQSKITDELMLEVDEQRPYHDLTSDDLNKNPRLLTLEAAVWLKEFVNRTKSNQEARCQVCLQLQLQRAKFPSSGTPEQKNINRQKREAICQDILLHVQSEVCTDDHKQSVDASMWAHNKLLAFSAGIGDEDRRMLHPEEVYEACYSIYVNIYYNQ